MWDGNVYWSVSAQRAGNKPSLGLLHCPNHIQPPRLPRTFVVRKLGSQSQIRFSQGVESEEVIRSHYDHDSQIDSGDGRKLEAGSWKERGRGAGPVIEARASSDDEIGKVGNRKGLDNANCANNAFGTLG